MNIAWLDASILTDANFSEVEKFGNLKVYKTTDENEIVSRLKDVDIAITSKVLITKEIIEQTNLKLICIAATGMDNVDLEYAKKKNIVVKNISGYSTNSVSQHTFACILYLLNKIKSYHEYTKDNEWAKDKTFDVLKQSSIELYGKNFGIIGLGEIGRQVAKIAKTFGANISYHSTSGKNLNSDYSHLTLQELLKTSNILSIHAPLNEKTKNLIGERELNLMKDGSLIANFGRGGIIDESALAKAIDEKNIMACLDVMEDEPLKSSNPLFNIKNKNNLLLTPHIAWASKEAKLKMITMTSQNIKDFLNGK